MKRIENLNNFAQKLFKWLVLKSCTKAQLQIWMNLVLWIMLYSIPQLNLTGKLQFPFPSWNCLADKRTLIIPGNLELNIVDILRYPIMHMFRHVHSDHQFDFSQLSTLVWTRNYVVTWSSTVRQRHLDVLGYSSF